MSLHDNNPAPERRDQSLLEDSSDEAQPGESGLAVGTGRSRYTRDQTVQDEDEAPVHLMLEKCAISAVFSGKQSDWMGFKRRFAGIAYTLGIAAILGTSDRDKRSMPYPRARVERFLYGQLLQNCRGVAQNTILRVSTEQEFPGTDAWTVLCATYDSASKTRLNQLREALYSAPPLQSGTDLEVYLQAMLDIKIQMQDIDPQTDDENVLFLITRGLPDEYRATIDKIDDAHPALNFEQAIARLRYKNEQLKDERRRRTGSGMTNVQPVEPQEATAAFVQARGRQARAMRGRGRGRGTSGPPLRAACWICGSFDHMKAQCPDREQPEQPNRGQQPANNRQAHQGGAWQGRDGARQPFEPNHAPWPGHGGQPRDNGNRYQQGRGGGGHQEPRRQPNQQPRNGACFVVSELPPPPIPPRWLDSSFYSEQVHQDQATWIIDSGATSHFSFELSDFVQLDRSDRTRVILANRDEVQAEGRGTVVVRARTIDDDEQLITIRDVLYVPSFGYRLLSVNRIVSNGSYVMFEHSGGRIETGDASFPIDLRNNHYCLDAWPDTSATELACTADPVLRTLSAKGHMKLWHERFAHAPERVLIEMSTQESVTGLDLPARHKQDEPHRCPACLLGKSTKEQQSTEPAQREYDPGERWDVDIQGPFTPASRVGNRYVIGYTDRASGYKVLYFLSNRSGVSDTLQRLITDHVRPYGYTIREIHADSGGEFYSSTAFRHFCFDKSVRLEYSSVDTPQQNGKAERSFRTVGDKARCMRVHAGMPIKFWEESYAAAAYVINRTASSANDGRTPYESYTGTIPDVSHLRVFGCAAYVHHEHTGNKLNERAWVGVFVGYDLESPCYLIYNRLTHRIMRSRNVQFDETQFTPLNLAHRGDFPTQTDTIDNDDVSSLLGPWPLDTLSPATVSSQRRHVAKKANIESQQLSEPLQIEQVPDQRTSSHPEPAVPEVNEVPALSPPSTPAFIPHPQSPRESVDSQSIATDHSSRPEGASEIGDLDADHDPMDELTILQARQLQSNFGEAPYWSRATDDRRPSGRQARACTPRSFVQDESAALCDDITIDGLVEPIGFRMAMDPAHNGVWWTSMTQECREVLQLETYEVVPRPEDRRVIPSQWVYKTKLNSDGSVKRLKSRIVACGNRQVPGVDFTDTFAPTVQQSSLRLLLAIATFYDFPIEQSDVSNAYLNASLDDDDGVEEIFMEQPPGFAMAPGGRLPNRYEADRDKALRQQYVCKLKKSLYGLRQAGRLWNRNLHRFMIESGFTQSQCDPCVYFKTDRKKFVMVNVFVDDLTYAGDREAITDFKLRLSARYNIRHEGPVEWILGMKVERESRITKLTQELYIQKILTEYGMENCKAAPTPLMKMNEHSDSETTDMTQVPYRQAVGSLMYLAVISRPDIATAVNLLARYVESPKPEHWQGVKRVFRYLKGTPRLGLIFDFRGVTHLQPIVFVDSDWAGDLDGRKSTSGVLVVLNNTPIVWRSTLQRTVATSVTEAEYVALCSATKEAVYIRRALEEMGVQCRTVPIFQDNQGSIRLAHNPVFHGRTKHIEVQYHYTRECVVNGQVDVCYVPTDENPADALTKVLDNVKFKKHLPRLMGGHHINPGPRKSGSGAFIALA
jgi:hypothetical protein